MIPGCAMKAPHSGLDDCVYDYCSPRQIAKLRAPSFQVLQLHYSRYIEIYYHILA